ncbi:cell division protein [Clostridium sporogenes]
MKKKALINYIPIITVAPSIIIGAMAMYINNVLFFIYIQNIFYLIILGLISYFVLSKGYEINKNRTTISILISVMFLFTTFINSGIENVHRWLSIGPIKFHVAAIVLPIIIINLWKLLQSKSWWFSSIIAICISIILVLQPDASMVTAFVIPMIILLWNTTNNIYRYFIVALLSGLIIFSWIFLDGLASVSYVEGIISLVANMGIIWLILGVISLMILPLPFLFFPPKEHKLLSLSIGIYFIVILISTLFGNFPVPLMGYGVSPIIGYFISITWLVKTKVNSLY